jgi:hypothetical protein
VDAKRLIPLAGLVGACAPYTGDWELTSLAGVDGTDTYVVSGSTGDMSIKGKKVELDFNIGGYAPFSGDGEVDDNGGGEFDLEISGSLSYYGLPLPAQVAAECEVDGDELTCAASFSYADGTGEGYLLPLLVAFERD